MTFVDQFGGKSAGELIRAELWNKLMAALDALESNVNEQLGELASEITPLIANVGQLQTEVATISSELTQYFKVSLSTTRVTYATGEEATIAAQVTDLAGNAVAFTDETRPWVDFVAVCIEQ